MNTKRLPALKPTAYVEIDYELLKATGEIKIISTPIIAPTITTKVPRGKFEITYTSELLGILEKLGNKKIQVFSYLLDKKDSNNTINTSIRKLSKETGISAETVAQTIKILQNAGLISRSGSVYMISPELMVKGNQMREAYLMRKYQEVNQQSIEENRKAIDVEVEPQLSFTAKGEIYQETKEI